MGYSITKVLIGMLFVSLAVLLIIIVYRKILTYLGKGHPLENDYCVLFSVEKNPASGEVEIYFTAKKPKHVSIEILDNEINTLKVLAHEEYKEGGHIIRFDSTTLPNGHYFYCLRTENQKTMKKIEIQNV